MPKPLFCWLLAATLAIPLVVGSQEPKEKSPTIYPANSIIHDLDREAAGALKQYCPEVTVLASRKNANYVVIYSEEGFENSLGVAKRDVTVIGKNDEVIFGTGSVWSKKEGVIKLACKAIVDDWKKKVKPPPKAQ